jgi:hypothetical protein
MSDDFGLTIAMEAVMNVNDDDQLPVWLQWYVASITFVGSCVASYVLFWRG